MTPKIHTEETFEESIENSLLQYGGYVKGDREDYDAALALEPGRVLEFIKKTQPKIWTALESIHGDNTAKVVIASLKDELEIKGILKVLRQGFKCYGKLLRVVYFAPNNRLNPESLEQYSNNRLSVTRQLRFGVDHGKSLDMVLFVNGLPVVTAELKNPFTGQTVEDAKAQYKSDRDPNELLFQFKKRALVHFAVDPDLAFMTTRLDREKTLFLPFNLGCNGGAGNPPSSDGTYRTSYLWKEVWQRDSLLEILSRFMHLQEEEKKIYTDNGIKTITKEVMIFPRYHQLDAVRRLIAHSRRVGSGHNYLVQHSAGSGKSNSIAWLAHRLSSLHDDNDRLIFNSVIVLTDRIVLDQQLQSTVYPFDHKAGVVQKIDDDTKQLVRALANDTPIIISTIHKFSFVTEALEKLNKENATIDGIEIATKGKRFAVIVDEAHSSQSGETAMEVKNVLNRDGVAEAAVKYMEETDTDESEDAIIRAMLKRGQQPNISFFAFTATPKYKTKHIFNEPGPDGTVPFHQYTMKQAIEERFIVDVLKNYTTYQTYYRIIQSTEDDPLVKRKKAARALARFLTLHPHNIRQKTEVMVEHFRNHVMHKIGGRAKAMVVTESRIHAVRYKQSFDEYIREKGYRGIKSLVAFSGSVEDPDVPGKSYTEVGMNGGIKEKELPKKFDTDEYRVLLVAEKYQTGFDQPYLHSMYVDKRLAGIQAVQTLSRLNRTCGGKEDTFVLDFRNERDDIYEAFKPFYEFTPVDDLIEAKNLYRLQHQIEEQSILFPAEVDELCKVYFQPKRTESKTDQGRMYAILDRAVMRFKKLEDESQEEFKSLLVSFRNMYGFLSQVIPFQDTDLEKLYTYIRFLLTKLPPRASGPGYHLEDEVQLQYYRLEKIGDGTIDLTGGEAGALKGPGDVGTGMEDTEVPLSELIDVLNERFGTQFTQADQRFFDQIEQEAVESEALKDAAIANKIEDFRSVFEKSFEGLILDRMEGNEELTAKLLQEPDFRRAAFENLLRKVYDRLTG